MITWHEEEVHLADAPKGLLLSLHGTYAENRVSIALLIAHTDTDDSVTVNLYDKAASVHEEALQAQYLYRAQKAKDSLPKTYAAFFRQMERHPKAAEFLSRYGAIPEASA